MFETLPTTLSSSSSGVYDSPSTRTASPTLTVPLTILANASNPEQSLFGNIFATYMHSGPSASHIFIRRTVSES